MPSPSRDASKILEIPSTLDVLIELQGYQGTRKNDKHIFSSIQWALNLTLGIQRTMKKVQCYQQFNTCTSTFNVRGVQRLYTDDF